MPPKKKGTTAATKKGGAKGKDSLVNDIHLFLFVAEGEENEYQEVPADVQGSQVEQDNAG